MEVTRVFDLLDHQIYNSPKEDALSTKINGSWQKYTTAEWKEISTQMALGFLELGIQKGDRIAIVSFNRPEWNFADYAIQFAGAISVPMYPNITVEDYSYIFKDADVKIAFVANSDLYTKVSKATAGLNVKIFSFDKIEGVAFWKELIEIGKNQNIQSLEAVKAQVNATDILTLIYTSGTTGNPKGVMLSHNNLIHNFKACFPLMPTGKEHRALSFLPLCHVYERMMSYLYTYCGTSIYYAESLETISDNLKEVKPHIFVTVPRLLEKVYDKIYAKGAELTGIKKMLFFWALELGLKFELNKNMGWWYNFQLKLANKLIFNKWREALGGNILAVVSGGAALQSRLARVFWAAQIPIMQGYGLTETSPVIAVNQILNLKNHKIGTVGPSVEGVDVKIAEDGEILVKGHCVMQGYFNKPELTAEVIDTEGWLHTGDIGQLEDGKFIRITDRKKEIFKTSGGKYIAPQPMENKFKESKFIEQIMVLGEGEKFPSALIVPNFEELKKWSDFKGISFKSNSDLIQHVDVLTKFQKEIDDLNENFAQYEKVKKFRLLPELWTIDSGELTAKLSLKRKIILQKNQNVIAEFYKL
ncbi:MAG: long-chain fatty acid--CoA ligase [Cytophagales bacterium]